MFLSNLSVSQQGVLLSLSQDIINRDDKVDEREQEVLNTIKSQCSENIEMRKVAIDDLGEIFTSKKEKVSLLIELIGVALADGEYHKNEAQLINNIAQELELETEVNFMHLWVGRQLSLFNEMNKFMGES